MRKGRRAYVFDDADVAMPIEAEVGGQGDAIEGAYGLGEH